MPRPRWDLSRLTSRAVQLTLLAAYIALVVWKGMTFLSEPTGSETNFESHFHLPYLTVCAYHGVGPRARDVIVGGSHEEQLEYFGNGTLLDVIRREGFTLLDLMPYLRDSAEYTADPSRANYTSRGGHWTTSVNYALGGLCGTLDVSGEEPYLKLARHYEFQELKENENVEKTDESDIAYELYVHRLKDFWGAKDRQLTLHSNAEMAYFDIMDGTDMQELVIDVEREIMPNMRRRPCVEDLSYSRSTCWRRCFFDWLDCSMEDAHANGKPPCKAVDIVWYHRAYVDYLGLLGPMDDEEGFVKFNRLCPCPHPCVLERYNILVRPSQKRSTRNNIRMKLFFKPVMRTVETRVTYGVIDLLADMGGFLGLLLGYSLLSVFDDVKTLATRMLEKRRSFRTTAPSGDIEQDLDRSFKERESEERRIGVHVKMSGTRPETASGPGVYSIRPGISTAWTKQNNSIHLSY